MKSALILAVCVLLVVAAPSMTAAQDDDIKKMRDEEPVENDPSDMKDIEETSDPMAAAEAKEEPLEIYQEEQPEDAFDVMVMFIYDGKYLELGANVQRSGLTMY